MNFFKKHTLFFVTSTIVVLALISFSGCTASAGKKYYQLYLPISAEQSAQIEKNPLHIDKILMVAPVQVDSTYLDYRVVYRSSPYEINYYNYNFWVKKPDRMVNDAIVDYLSECKVFRRVISKFPEGTPDLLLKAYVHVIEEVDSSKIWFGHLRMDIQIRDFKTDKEVLSHSFDRQLRLRDKKIELLPKTISRILKEELDTLIKKLSHLFEKRWAKNV